MIMAGGTDLINFMQARAIVPEYVVDIKNIPEMSQLEFDEKEGLIVGALTKLRDIELSPLVQEKYPALAEAVHVVASTQVRSKGTLAGNICNASPSADTVPALIALGASLEIKGTEHPRRIPLDEFYLSFKKMALEPGEIVRSVRIPVQASNTRAAYIKHAFRKAMDLAVVGVGASITIEDGVCVDARLALGAVAPTAVRARNAEEVLIGSRLTNDVLEAAGKAAMNDCSPISDVRASAEYRHDMVRVFTKRAVKKALERF